MLSILEMTAKQFTSLEAITAVHDVPYSFEVPYIWNADVASVKILTIIK
jgi:hypothetical protein